MYIEIASIDISPNVLLYLMITVATVLIYKVFMSTLNQPSEKKTDKKTEKKIQTKPIIKK